MRLARRFRLVSLPAAVTAAALFVSPAPFAAPRAVAGGLCGTLADELAAERAGLEVEWRVTLPIDHSQGGIEHVVFGDGLVIVQAGDGGVHAILTGPVTPDGRCNPQVIWSTHLGSPGQPIVTAAIGPDVILAPRGNELYALERATGQVRWQRHLDRSPITAPAVVGGWVYQPEGAATVLRIPTNPWRDTGIRGAAGTGTRQAGGRAAAVSDAARTGRGKPASKLTSAEKRARMQDTESLEPLHLNGGGIIERDPIAFGDGLLWTTRNGEIVSLQQGDRGWIRENFSLDSPQAGPLATRGDAIFATTTARDLARIDSLDAGAELRVAWRVLLDGQPEEDGPFVAGERIVVSLGDDGLRCYSTETGDLLWANRCPGRILAVTGDRIWVEDRTSHLSSFDLATGEPLSQYCFGPFTSIVANRSTDRLILATGSGTIVCLKEKDAAAPRNWSAVTPLPEPGTETAPRADTPVRPDPPEHLGGDLFDDAPAADEGDAGDDAMAPDDQPADDMGDSGDFGDEPDGGDPFESRDS